MQLTLFHSDEILDDEYTLMDVAYITAWNAVSSSACITSLTPNIVKRIAHCLLAIDVIIRCIYVVYKKFAYLMSVSVL